MTEGEVASVIQKCAVLGGQLAAQCPLCVIGALTLSAHRVLGTQGAQGPKDSVLAEYLGGALRAPEYSEYAGYPKGQLGLTPRGEPQKNKNAKKKNIFFQEKNIFLGTGVKSCEEPENLLSTTNDE